MMCHCLLMSLGIFSCIYYKKKILTKQQQDAALLNHIN